MTEDQTTVPEAVAETVPETTPAEAPKATKKRTAKVTDDEDRGVLTEVVSGISFYIKA